MLGRSSASWVCAVAMGMLAAPTFAQVRAQFDVPPQALADSLLAIGRQAGINVLFDPPLVEGRDAPGVNAELTIDEALTLVFAGSGLKHRFLDDQTVVVITEGRASSRADSASSRGESTNVEEIIVTATRREESLRDVPQSLNVLTGEALTDVGARSIRDYAALLPGLQLISIQPGGWSIQVLRGISTGIQSSSATVGTYFDDTPITGASFASFGQSTTPDPDLFDVQRIEVLKGPQGTLYGASAMGGLIRYVSTPPNLRQFEGKAELGYESVADGGSGNSQRALVNIPLVNDVLAVRLDGFRIAYPGFIDSLFRHQEDINEGRSEGGRMSALWAPTEKLSLRLTSYYQTIAADSLGSMDVDPLTLQRPFGDLASARKMPEPSYAKWFVNNLALDYDVGWFNLLSSTSYSKQKLRSSLDQSSFFAPVLAPLIGGNAGVITTYPATDKLVQEFRLTSPGGEKVEWIAGLYYTDEDSEVRQAYDQYNAAGAAATLLFPGAFTATLSSKLVEHAGFATLTYHFSPSFDLQAGVRHSRIEQDFAQRDIALLGTPTQPDSSASARESKLTYLGVARFHFSEDTMLYARVASGYRPGGPNIILPGSQAPSSYESDSLVSYEIGLKGALAARSFDYSVSAFRVNWEDIQVTGIDPGSGVGFYDNGSKAHSEGVEAELGYRPMAGLRLGLSGTWLSAKLDEDIPISGITSRAGNELPYAPRFAYAANVDYEHALTDRMNGFAGLTVAGSSDRYAYFAEQEVGSALVGFLTPTGKLPSYTSVDLRAGVRFDRVEVSAYVRNLADKRAAFSLIGNSVGLDLDTGMTTPAGATIIQPRTFAVTVRFEFD